MSFHRFVTACCLLITAHTLSACGPLVIGGAGATGVAVAQERTVGRAIDDATIHSRILHRFLQTDVNELLPSVGVEVNEGTVLLTGSVEKPETAITAVKLVWQVDGVHEVINEIQVTDRTNIKDFAKDTWITAQVKSRLIAEKGVASINYSVETVNGRVYLMGIAQNEQELERVVNVTSRVKGVQQVISHVRMKADPRREANS
ncbi:MAG: BON domain-containing protein [Rickettsiales bacterium]